MLYLLLLPAALADTTDDARHKVPANSAAFTLGLNKLYNMYL